MKFNGRHSSQVNRVALMQELSANNTAIIPFSIDHLGGIGTFAHSLLFGKKHHHATPTPPPPLSPIRFEHPDIQASFHRSAQLDIAFFLTANATWTNLNRTLPSPIRYGTTYRTATPLQWAFQNLALNFSFALSHHFAQALRLTCNRSNVSATIVGTEHIPCYSDQRAPSSHIAPASPIVRIIPGRAS